MGLICVVLLFGAQEDGANGDYGGYHTWPEIREKIGEWKRRQPGLVQETAIGKTLQGRNIVALKISDHADRDEDEPEVLLMAGIHPREQPAQVLLVRLIDEILREYGKDERITRLVDQREIWVIPIFNVDGKVHDMKHGNGKDRGVAQRKNLNGVDLNRQFPVRWGGSTDLRTKPKTTLDPKSDYFIGWGPLEEPESKVLEEFFRSRPLRAFVDIHSPFKAIYFPRHLPDSDHARYTELAQAMRDLQKDKYDLSVARRGEDPPAERGGDAGVSYDWAYYTHGVYAFIFEVFADPKWYPPIEQIDGEYANFREPMLHLIDASAKLPLRRDGSAKLRSASLDREPSPGAIFSWTPSIEGDVEFGVLVSGSAAVRVTSEFRTFPLRRGFSLRTADDAKPGMKVPMTLYLWDARRGRTIVRFELTIRDVRKLRVGLYDFGDEGGSGVKNLQKCLAHPPFEVTALTAADIRDGALDRIDVLLVPGGSGSKQADELEEKGREAIRAFVRRGGGYVGFCAGAYLASAQYSWSLHLLDAKVIDREHWARGTGSVKIKLNGAGRDLLGSSEIVDIYYGQGPLLGPADSPDIPDFEALAWYETEIAKNGAPSGVMKGTVAVARAPFGKGRVFCFSPHPESTDGLDYFVERAVEWAAGLRP
jgi:hypothetical protein